MSGTDHDLSAHRAWLDDAVQLARQGRYLAEPNPPVGALVVHAGRVVGRGAHRRFGGPHAEIEALAEAKEAARGATLIVTLEPCSTAGKTPPCVDAIARAGVAGVVFAAADPNPAHAGRARALLEPRGIRVDGPLDHPASDALLSRFRAALLWGRPHVTAKWAMTLDGAVASRSGASRWITGEPARAIAHELRGVVDAVAVGVGTVLADDPELTARPPGPRRALRVAFDRALRVPETWRALHDGGPGVVVVHGPDAPPERRAALERLGAALIVAEGASRVDRVRDALTKLRARGIASLMVEGGPGLLGAFVDARCVDRVMACVAPRLLGGRDARHAVDGVGFARLEDALTLVDWTAERAGDDLVLRGLVGDAAD